MPLGSVSASRYERESDDVIHLEGNLSAEYLLRYRIVRNMKSGISRRSPVTG
jgi:hypothetical protein